MNVAHRSLVVLIACGAAGCAYYNALWRANRLADEARRAERAGRRGEAETLWEQAALKAESVTVRHPNSKWADDALALQGAALAELGRCPDAIEPLERAVASSRTDPRHEMLASETLARCAIETGDPWRAHAAASRAIALAQTIGRRTGDVASRAHRWRGEANALRGDHAAAVDDFRASDEPEARVSEAFALSAIGDTAIAAALLDSIVQAAPAGLVITPLVVGLGQLDRARATRALARLVETGDARRAGAIMVDAGSDALEAGDTAWASELYRRALDVELDREAFARAQLGLVALDLSAASDRVDLEARAPRLRRLVNTATAEGREASRLSAAVERILTAATDAQSFLAAEVARDVLRAPALSETLFRRLVARWPESAFAPKALFALATLNGSDADSLYRVARVRYPRSPYVLVLEGRESVGFTFLEDSLRRVGQSWATRDTVTIAVPRAPIRIGPRWVRRPPTTSGRP